MATFYFNGAVDNDWATLGNWWMDVAFTAAATSLPTSADDVIATASISSNNGSEPTVANFTLNDPSVAYHSLEINITITGICTLNGGSTNNRTINGNCVFNDYSSNNGYLALVNGNATFNDSSHNDSALVSGNATFNDYSTNYYGTVNGDATFNDSSRNDSGTVTGDATFNDSSINYGTVTGDATFNHNSYLSVYGSVNGTSTFNDASYMEPNNANYTNNPWTVVLGTRTPYPLRYGINNSNILGII